MASSLAEVVRILPEEGAVVSQVTMEAQGMGNDHLAVRNPEVDASMGHFVVEAVEVVEDEEDEARKAKTVDLRVETENVEVVVGSF